MPRLSTPRRVRAEGRLIESNDARVSPFPSYLSFWFSDVPRQEQFPINFLVSVSNRNSKANKRKGETTDERKNDHSNYYLIYALAIGSIEGCTDLIEIKKKMKIPLGDIHRPNTFDFFLSFLKDNNFFVIIQSPRLLG